MKKLISIIITSCIIGMLSVINAQKLSYGIFLGGNCNFLSQKSDYTITDDSKMGPAISYNFGGNIKYNFNKTSLLCSAEYSRISNKFTQTISDYYAYNIEETKSWINNHYVVLNSIFTINITDDIYIGSGLSASFLLWSSLRTKEKLHKYQFEDGYIYLGDDIGKIFTIHNYKRILFSIPVIIGYELNRLNLFARLNIGAMNRIKGDSYVHEFENPITLGIGYNFSKH